MILEHRKKQRPLVWIVLVQRSDRDAGTVCDARGRQSIRPVGEQNLKNPIWFKTGKGEYAEGDKFIGVSVPIQRAIAKKYGRLELGEIEKLLKSHIHEHRFTGLAILVAQYEGGDPATKQRVFDFYVNHTHCINNWDLVDTSAPYIIGEHLVFRSRQVLFRMAKSFDWWERRIAIVATAALIDRGDLKDSFAIATCLLADQHDLVHKATGWMLRKAGEHSRSQLMGFLKRNYSRMPRTALRYAVEHLPEAQRKRALKGLFA
jgi:3-methyladenine DNA glycosylase AlkD